MSGKSQAAIEFDLERLADVIRRNFAVCVIGAVLGIAIAAGIVFSWMAPRYSIQWNVKISNAVPGSTEPAKVAKAVRLVLGRDAAAKAFEAVAEAIAGSDQNRADRLARLFEAENSRYVDDPKRAPFRLVANGAGSDMTLVMNSPVSVPEDRVRPVGQTFLDHIVSGYNAAQLGAGLRDGLDEVRRLRVELYGQIAVLEAALIGRLTSAGFSVATISSLVLSQQERERLERASAVLGVLVDKGKLSKVESGAFADRIVELAGRGDAIANRAALVKDGPLPRLPSLSPDGVAFSEFMWHRPAAVIGLGGVFGAWLGVLFGLLRSRRSSASRTSRWHRSRD